MNLPLILSADGSDNIYTYADAAFAVHPDMKSHNGAGLTLGRGFAISFSGGQRLNTSSSTTAEIVCVSDTTYNTVDTIIRTRTRIEGKEEYNIPG